ncbi:glycosyltransferase 52 family protein [Vibrio sp. 99-70-13A1]|uniref:glycosyltransferase 52 family protein n=1 Tax=Vibrio sp. 99-70-13A1 TaxID=2607601 RepID=UPI001493504B|nr:glycosyltransferase 52 family protein [Vibrio sp. 99-70-13A1]NOH96092.1 glycosyltransferase 52 family protein [Vibrio sp. 99-70-13A1]
MNLFLVTSPFQYLCAEEALSAYKTENNILLLVKQGSEPGISQEKKLLDRNKWQHIIEIPRDSRSKHVPKAINQVRKIIKDQPLSHFFHAEYSAWRTKLILRNLVIEKEVYCDDGTLTINEYEESIRTKLIYSRPRFIQDLMIRIRRCTPIGQLEQSKNLELFTIFDIKQPNHSVIKNNLTEVKKKYNAVELYDDEAPIGFIGQGSIGHKRMKSIATYLKEIKHFSESMNKKIIYFPHRTESEEVTRQVKKIKNLEYHYSQMPLEIELIEKKIKLSALVGILSTVQYTSLILYKGMPVFNLVNPNTEQDYTLTDLERNREKRIHELFKEVGIKDVTI